MFEDEREKFWRIYREEDERRKINIKRLSKKIGFAPSTVYKFHQKCAGSHDLLESISVEIFGVSWTETIAKQEAERNQGQEADNAQGDGRMSDDYIRSLEKRIDALQMALEQHVKAHHQPRSDDLKKTA